MGGAKSEWEERSSTPKTTKGKGRAWCSTLKVSTQVSLINCKGANPGERMLTLKATQKSSTSPKAKEFGDAQCSTQKIQLRRDEWSQDHPPRGSGKSPKRQETSRPNKNWVEPPVGPVRTSLRTEPSKIKEEKARKIRPMAFGSSLQRTRRKVETPVDPTWWDARSKPFPKIRANPAKPGINCELSSWLNNNKRHHSPFPPSVNDSLLSERSHSLTEVRYRFFLLIRKL